MTTALTPVGQLIADLRAAGYRAWKSGWRGRYEVIVEGQAGRLSANAPRAVFASIVVNQDGSRIGDLVGTGRTADDGLSARGEAAIRALLIGGAE
jgi:hypothetical protein